MTKNWHHAINQAIFCSLLILPFAANAASDDKPKPVEVIGTVEVSNLPGTQDIKGTVSIDNLPSVQNVSGDVNVTNLPAVQQVTGTVSVDNFSTDPQTVIIDQSSGEPVHVVGPVDIVTMPEVTIGDVSQTARLNVKLSPDSEVAVNNLDQLKPELVRGGEDVITPDGDLKEIFPLLHNMVMTDLVVFNAGNYLDCLVEIGEQWSHGWIPFFSFMPDKGLNQINFSSGITPTVSSNYLLIRVSNGDGQCGASLLWTGFESES